MTSENTQEEQELTREIPSIPGVINADQVVETARSIIDLQQPDGMILWFEGGHSDPWNHVEAAMALSVAGFTEHAERAYRWLEASQLEDGSWYNYYVVDGVEDYRKDTNVCAYIATGVWHHYLVTRDESFLVSMWATMENAIDFVVSLQRCDGGITWCIEPDESMGKFALLTGSSSIYHSIRCALKVAETLGKRRSEWESCADKLRHALANDTGAFEPKDRWAMDWYYPVLSGAVVGDAASSRIASGWPSFVVEGKGVRCVSDRPWITAAETAECVIALDAAGMTAEALELLGWVQFLRDDSGAYWTGWVFPDDVHFPGGERTTYTSAAIILAAHVLSSSDEAAAIFRSEAVRD